jgi:hypothetical protein
MRIYVAFVTSICVIASFFSGYGVGKSEGLMTPVFVQVTPSPSPEPEVKPSNVIVGVASWFDAKRSGQSTWYSRAGVKYYAAAGPALRAVKNFRYGMNPYPIKITNLKNGRSVIALVVDWCECPAKNRIVDLAPALFKELGVDLSVGLQKVSIEVIE